jgi:glutamate racemase
MAISPPDPQRPKTQTKENHFCCGFLVVLLNKYMNKDKTESWLKGNGLRSTYFTQIPLLQAQAVSAAYNLLKQRVGLLSAEQTLMVNMFCRANQSARTRARITEAQCFEILKIAKQANRSLFKEDSAAFLLLFYFNKLQRKKA